MRFFKLLHDGLQLKNQMLVFWCCVASAAAHPPRQTSCGGAGASSDAGLQQVRVLTPDPQTRRGQSDQIVPVERF